MIHPPILTLSAKALTQSLAFLLIVPLLTLSSARADSERYLIDPDHTVVAMLIDHVGFSRVLGRFNELEGAFDYDQESGELANLRIVVQAASFDSAHEKRDEHVRNKDFLDVKNHAEIVFSVDGPVVVDADGGSVEGVIELLGEQGPLSLDVSLNKSAKYPFGHKKYTLGISARGSLQRSDYGMDYGVANGLVGDRVDLIIETEAIRN